MTARIFLSGAWLLAVFGAWSAPAENVSLLYRFMIAALIGVLFGSMFLLFEILMTRKSIFEESRTSDAGNRQDRIGNTGGPVILLIILFFGSLGVLMWIYLDQGKGTLDPPDLKQAKSEIQKKIFLWKSLSEARDLESNLKNYADHVEYYDDKDASRDQIRRYKQKDSAPYDTIRFNLNNLNIIPDPERGTATIVFDKEWKFTGPGKSSTGKVQQQLRMEKINGQWLITAEKVLK